MTGTEDTRSNSLLSQVDRGVLGLVQELYRTVARLVRNRLVNRVNGEMQIRYGTVEIASLGRVMDRIQSQDGGAFATFRLQPANVPGVIVIQGQLLYRLVGVMLGESSEGEPSLYHWRPLTPVDLRIAQRVCDDILGGLIEASPMPVPPDVVLESVTANPRVRTGLPRGTTVIEASLDFGPPDNPYGLVSIILPGQATGILWPSRTHRPQGSREASQEGISRVMPLPVTAVAELARVRLPLAKVRQLRVGTMLELGNLRDVEVRVGGKPALVAEPGERDGVRSIRVKRKLGGDEGNRPQ